MHEFFFSHERGGRGVPALGKRKPARRAPVFGKAYFRFSVKGRSVGKPATAEVAGDAFGTNEPLKLRAGEALNPLGLFGGDCGGRENLEGRIQ